MYVTAFVVARTAVPANTLWLPAGVGVVRWWCLQARRVPCLRQTAERGSLSPSSKPVSQFVGNCCSGLLLRARCHGWRCHRVCRRVEAHFEALQGTRSNPSLPSSNPFVAFCLQGQQLKGHDSVKLLETLTPIRNKSLRSGDKAATALVSPAPQPFHQFSSLASRISHGRLWLSGCAATFRRPWCLT